MLISAGNTKNTLQNIKFEKIRQKDILKIYPNGKYLPLVNDGDFDVLRSLFNNKTPLKRLASELTKGDFNLGISKDEFSTEPTQVKMYRGKNIHRYQLDQNINEYMNPDFLKEYVNKNSKNQYLVSQNISGTTDEHRLHFCLTNLDERFLCGDSVNKFLLKDEANNNLILAILNSNLMDWYFRKTSTNNHVNSYEIKEFPIPILSRKYNYLVSEVIELADKIIQAKKENPDADTQELEKQIDQLVYKLYELTDEEIRIVEEVK